MKEQVTPAPLSLADKEIISEARSALKALETRALESGGRLLKEYDRLQYCAYAQWRERVWLRAKHGTKSEFIEMPAIQELLEMADFATRRLHWLALNRPDDVKPHARRRDTWPAYLALWSEFEKGYRDLLPSSSFNQAGERTADGPIGLGADLPFRPNRKTKHDVLFQIAKDAVNYLINHPDSFRWLYLAPCCPQLAKLKSDAKAQREREFIDSLGPFTRGNWPHWQPVFASYLSLRYGPPEDRQKLLELLPGRLRKNSLITQTLSRLITGPSLLDSDSRTIKTIVERNKTGSEWRAVKKELLKRISKLALLSRQKSR